jgi:LacI family transcriptional regulator
MKQRTSARGAVRAPAEPVTLGMVAQAAGVSPSTVSRILNGTAAVSADKKQAVQDAIAQLGFVPNPVARSLAGGRSFSIGVVTQAIDSPFYGAALRGVEEVCDAAGYQPLFVSGHWSAVSEARCIEVLRSRRVDGIIVLTGRLTDAALKGCAKLRQLRGRPAGRAASAAARPPAHRVHRRGCRPSRCERAPARLPRRA